jgi:hypothetical protein
MNAHVADPRVSETSVGKTSRSCGVGGVSSGGVPPVGGFFACSDMT